MSIDHLATSASAENAVEVSNLDKGLQPYTPVKSSRALTQGNPAQTFKTSVRPRLLTQTLKLNTEEIFVVMGLSGSRQIHANPYA